MKKQLTLVALVLCVVMCVCALVACDNTVTDKKLTVLDAPTNVRINLGSDAYASDDDTVSFDTVEHATSYQVYVYKEGDETAKVTTGTETTVALASPLDAGSYKVSVVAVGDVVNYANSNGSTPVDYTVEQRTVSTLGTVSNIKIDFSKVDEANAVYPVISFDGVANASRYLVDIFAANADHEKQLTSLGYTTRLTVPADQTKGYMMDSTNYDDLAPGYFVVEVTAVGDGEYTLNGEIASANCDWLGAKATKPEISVTNVDNGGVSVELTNYESYKSGTTFTINVYSDAKCTTLVTTKTLEFTSSTSMFGQVSYNKTVAIKVVEADGEGDVKVGTEYFVTASLDGVLYSGDITSDTQSITPAKAGEGTTSSGGNQGGGGFPGGGGQDGPGGGGGATLTFTSCTLVDGNASVSISAMGTAITCKATKLDTANAGSTHSYTLSGSGGMGEAVTGTIELKADGTAVIEVSGFGPFSKTTFNGTWETVDGVLTFTKA